VSTVGLRECRFTKEKGGMEVPSDEKAKNGMSWGKVIRTKQGVLGKKESQKIRHVKGKGGKSVAIKTSAGMGKNAQRVKRPGLYKAGVPIGEAMSSPGKRTKKDFGSGRLRTQRKFTKKPTQKKKKIPQKKKPRVGGEGKMLLPEGNPGGVCKKKRTRDPGRGPRGGQSFEMNKSAPEPRRGGGKSGFG